MRADALCVFVFVFGDWLRVADQFEFVLLRMVEELAERVGWQVEGFGDERFE